MAEGRVRSGERGPGRGRGWPPLVYAPLARALSALVVGLVPLVLGYVGLRAYLSGSPVAGGYGHGWPDLLFYDLQLPILSAAPVQGAGPYPVPLAIARLLAPAVAALATVGALRLLLAEQWRRWSAAAARRHAVVVGDGPVAIEIARRLREQARTVVLLGSAGATLDWARANRVLAVSGDAADPGTLRAAGIARAGELYACTGLSTANAAIVLRARDEVAEGRKYPLAAYALVRDVELAVALRARRVGTSDDPRLRLDFFDVEDIAARKLLDRYPLVPAEAAGDGAPGAAPVRVVIVGFGQLGRAVLREVARRYRPSGGAHRPEVVLPGAADADVAAVTAAFPVISSGCVILPGPGPSLSDAGYNAVLVCVDSDDDALREGLAMAHALGGRPGHVVVCLDEAAPFAGVLAVSSGLVDDVLGRLRVFGVIQEACVPADIRDDFTEQLARSIHRVYLVNQAAMGETGATNSAMVPWERLPESLRRANVAQARAIGDKVKAVGAVVVPESAGAARFAFTGEEVERLSRLEHDRWMADRLADGWTYGEPRDNERKLHPDLRAWDELTQECRDKDRNAVRAIPEVLLNAGFQVIRLASS